MAQVADFSTPVDLHAVATHWSGIVRYVSDYSSKNITKPEFDLAQTLKLTVTLVCEQGAQPALRGTAGGQHDSAISNQQADAIGYDKASTIYYVAEDPSRLDPSQWPAVEAYFRALTGRPKGAYGGLMLVTHLINLGLASKGWVVETWGGINNQVQLEQMVNGQNVFGLAVDVNNVLQADYGQHPRPGGATVTYPGLAGGQEERSHMCLCQHPVPGREVDLLWVGDQGNVWHSWAPTFEGLFAPTVNLENLMGQVVSVSGMWSADGDKFIVSAQGVDNKIYIKWWTVSLGKWIDWTLTAKAFGLLPPSPVGAAGAAGPAGPPGGAGPAGPIGAASTVPGPAGAAYDDTAVKADIKKIKDALHAAGVAETGV